MERKDVRVPVSLPLKDLGAWQRFVRELKTENRFALSEESTRFVDLLIEYAGAHKAVSLPESTRLFRARIQNIGSEKAPFPLDRMGAPPATMAGHGRLNPRGIPYLYLASEEITAVGEVRPWVGARITVAEFRLMKNCTFINFSQCHMVNVPEGEEFKGAEFTWRELISWMFSAPFDPRDDTAYIPTQYLAERIKRAGYDGIVYDSALSATGYNVTLFTSDAASAVRRRKARVKQLTVEADFEPIPEGNG